MAMEINVEEKREGRGKPKKRWMDRIKNYLHIYLYHKTIAPIYKVSMPHRSLEIY